MSSSTASPTRADLRSDGPAEDSPDRWVSYQPLAWLLRIIVVASPVAAAVGASIAIELSVRRPQGWMQLWWWSATLLASALAAAAVERGVRRLTPLATLLRLTLLFPDKAPSRFKIARTAANPARLAELADSDDDRSNAAAQVLALMAQLSRHDRLTRGHSERVRVFADLIAEEMGVVGEDRDKLRWGALIHDIGKISVPAAVLNKRGRPDAVEWSQIQGHPAAGESYAGPLFGWLGPWAGAITEHHERWDGTGYPRRIAGNDLTLGGRIVAVADAYETMTAARSYKKALSVEAARRELTVCAGHQFDPEVVRAFLLISVGRFSRALGPLSWLAHVPFALHLQSAAARLGAAASAAGPATALGVGGLAVVGASITGVAPTAVVAHVGVHTTAAHAPRPVTSAAVDAPHTLDTRTIPAPVSNVPAASHDVPDLSGYVDRAFLAPPDDAAPPAAYSAPATDSTPAAPAVTGASRTPGGEGRLQAPSPRSSATIAAPTAARPATPTTARAESPASPVVSPSARAIASSASAGPASTTPPPSPAAAAASPTAPATQQSPDGREGDDGDGRGGDKHHR